MRIMNERMCALGIVLSTSDTQARVSTLKKFRVYWLEETTEQIVTISHDGRAVCGRNKWIYKEMHKSRNFSNYIFVVILYDLYNNKCVEIGFAIHLVKSHPKQQKEMSLDL